MGIASPYSYICYKDPDIATTWVAESTTKESSEIVSGNVNTVLQTAIDNVAATEAAGGKILLKSSFYWGTAAAPIAITMKDNIHLMGEGWDGTRMVGRIDCLDADKCSISDLTLITNTLTSNGKANINISNSKFATLRNLKMSSDILVDPIVFIDDTNGAGGAYSSTILIDNCYFLSRFRGLHLKGNINNIHVDRCLFAQSSGSRSTDPNCVGIFIDNSATNDPLFTTIRDCYLEKYYAGIHAQSGYWKAPNSWIDDCEYGVVLDASAISAGAIEFDTASPGNIGYHAKVGGTTNYGPGASVKNFSYRSPSRYTLERGVKL